MNNINTIVNNKYKTIVQNNSKNNSKYYNSDDYLETTKVLDRNSDLYSDSYREYMAKLIHDVGAKRASQLASVARSEGRQPDRYFVWLLKNAIETSTSTTA